VSTREHRPEYLYFSPTRLSVAGIVGAIATAAISSFAVIQVWPAIDIFAQRLRTTATLAAIEPERVYAVPELAMTPRAANSTTTEASIRAVGSPSEAKADNSQIPPIDRSLKGTAFWAAQKVRVEAITALVHRRWALASPRGAESELVAPAPSAATDALTCGRTEKRSRECLKIGKRDRFGKSNAFH
jgi:hypothetical protein